MIFYGLAGLISGVFLAIVWSLTDRRHIARRDSVPPVPRRAMQQMLEHERPNDVDGTP